MNDEQRMLTTQITHYVNAVATSCDRERKAFMSKYLSEFVQNAVAKFEHGQREHGGNLLSRNLPIEMYQETMDMFWYGAALRENLRISADHAKDKETLERLMENHK